MPNEKLPKHWIEHTANWRSEPMAYWVHIPVDKAEDTFWPAAPLPDGKKGFRVLCVETHGTILRFSSRAQLEEFISILSKKPLPTSRRLSAIRATGAGPNGHWLSRLPIAIKSPTARAQVVQKLALLLNEFGI